MDRHINQLVFNDTIIKPPNQGREDTRRVVVDVNSSSRNYTFYNTPAEYTYYLNEPITNIIEVELSSMNISKCLYNVNAYNNRLYFAQNVNVVTGYDKNGQAIRDNTGFLLQANMPKGNYKICISETTNLVTADDFASNLVSVLDANITTNFAMTLDVNKDKYRIDPTSILANNTSVLFYNTNGTESVEVNGNTATLQNKLLTNTIGGLVGMTRLYSPFISGNVNTTNSSTTITGQGTAFLTDLEHLVADDQITIVNADVGGTAVMETLQIASIDSDTQITLKSTTTPNLTRSNCELAPVVFNGDALQNVEGDDVVYLHIEEFKKLNANKQGSQGAFCKINMNKGTIERIGSNVNLKHNTHNYQKKLERINRLTISFKDVNGNIVDLNGREHNFTLAFNCFTHSLGYNV